MVLNSSKIVQMSLQNRNRISALFTVHNCFFNLIKLTISKLTRARYRYNQQYMNLELNLIIRTGLM